MESNYFYLAFIPIIVAQIIARVYLLKYLDQPARYKGAPWYVNLSFNSGVGKLFDLKETVLFYLIGLIGFIVVFLLYIENFVFGIGVIILFLFSLWMYWKAIVWMDENERWGTRKQPADIHLTSNKTLLKKDFFIVFNSLVLFVIILLFGINNFKEYVEGKGQEAGKKDVLEQIRQDSLQSINK